MLRLSDSKQSSYATPARSDGNRARPMHLPYEYVAVPARGKWIASDSATALSGLMEAAKTRSTGKKKAYWLNAIGKPPSISGDQRKSPPARIVLPYHAITGTTWRYRSPSTIFSPNANSGMKAAKPNITKNPQA